MDLTGDWKGSYFYLETDQNGDPYPSNEFVMTLTQSEYGALSGTVRDLPPEGGDETGRISGFVNEFNLSLVKVMPVMYVTMPDAILTFAELVEKETGESLKEIPLHAINYVGKWYEGEKTFRGSWEIPEAVHTLQSGKTYAVGSSSGSWKMSRVKPPEISAVITEGKESQIANLSMSQKKS